MKMKPDHYEELKKIVTAYMSQRPELTETYETGKFLRAEAVNNLQVRFVWDCYYKSEASRVMRSKFDYLLDSHIETALKRICPTVTRRY